MVKATQSATGLGPPTGLVGRDGELGRIVAALEIACTQSGRFVLISGEAGVGKTRLAREVLALGHARRLQVVVGRCFEQFAAVPFYPFTEALSAAFAAEPEEHRDAAAQRWPELKHLLPELSDAAPKPVAQDTQLRVFRAGTEFLNHRSLTDPLVLLLEDLHWADATSLGLLLYLGRHLQSSHILVIGTYRDVELGRQHPLEETLRELVRDRLVDEIHLRRLDLASTAALISNQLSDDKIPDELVSVVYARSEGNPFFTEELLKALSEQGAIYQAGGRLDPKRLAEIQIPYSVRSVVGQRVGRLSSGTQELLRTASVLGPEFDLALLQVASGVAESDVLDHMDAAVGTGLLEDRSRNATERYAFAHVLIQQTLYQELPSHRRRRLHLRVGQALESLAEARPFVIADLARHFQLGGDHERAATYAVMAGDQASAHCADAEAVHHYEVALDLLAVLGDEPRATYVQYRLGGELYDLNRIADALAAYAGALEGFTHLEDTVGQALAHAGLGRLYSGLHDFKAAVPHFDAALRLWPPEREDARLAAVLFDYSTALYEIGDFATDNVITERGLALAEQLGDPALVAYALSRLAIQRFRQDPRPRIRMEIEARAISVARRTQDWRTLSRLFLGAAMSHQLAGELKQCLADRQQASRAAELSGETERIAFAHAMVAWTHYRLGDWTAGRAAARTALAHDPRGQLRALPTSAMLAWMEGRQDDASRELLAFLDDTRGRADMQRVCAALVILAEWALELNRPADAEQPAREEWEMLRIGGIWQPWPGYGCGPLAETLVRLGAPGAEAFVAEAGKQLELSEQHFGRPQLLRARALLCEQKSDLDEAFQVLQVSAEVARSQHALIQLGQTLSTLVRIAQGLGNATVAADAETELAAVVHGIGPEVRALPWAKGSSVPRRRPSSATHGTLTARERDVVALIAEGRSNRQIAEQLVISERTAEHHVESILNKLGLSSRAQVAAWFVRPSHADQRHLP